MRKSLILFFLIISCGDKISSNKDKAPSNKISLSVWAEFLPYSDYKEIFPQLKKLGVELFLAIREGNLQDPTLRELDFRAWLLLKKEKGYWISVWNAQDFFEFTKEFINSFPNIMWIILDFEPPWEVAEKISNSKDTFEFLSNITLAKPTDDIYENGRKKIEELIDFAHKNGKKVLCVFPPYVIDDFVKDNDQDISKFSGIYVPETCDEYSFMLYTTILKTLAANFNIEIKNPEFFVYSYSKDAVKIFGEKTAIDVGLVGKDLFGNPGYSSPEELKRDISAGISAGVKKFHIWTLDNMREEGEWKIEKWLDLGEIQPKEPPEDESIKKIRELFKILD